MTRQGCSDSLWMMTEDPGKTDAQTVNESPRRLDIVKDEPAPNGTEPWPPANSRHSAPYSTRLRVVLLLSLACWVLVILAVAVLRRLL